MKTNINELVQASLLKAVGVNEALEHHPESLRKLIVHRLTVDDKGSKFKRNIEHVPNDSSSPAAVSARAHSKKLNDLQYSGHPDDDLHVPLSRYTQTQVARDVNAHLITKSQHNYGGERRQTEWEKLGAPDVLERVHKEQSEYAEKLSNHIQKHAMPLPEESHMYSGIKFDMKQIHEKGGVFHTPAFTSTSVDIHTAADFAGNIKHTSIIDDNHETGGYLARRIHDAHVIHFKLPKGYKKGMHAEPVSSYEHEKEYVLDKGQTWKITGHKRINQTDIESRDGTNSFQASTKNIRRVHIWTVEPHEVSKNVSESKYHEPNILKGFSKSSSNYTTGSFDTNHINEAYKHIPDSVRYLSVHRLVTSADGMSHLKRRYNANVKDKRKEADDSGFDHINDLNKLHFKPTDDNRTLHEPLALYTNTKTARNVNGYLISNSHHEYEGSRAKSDPEVLYDRHSEARIKHNEAQAEYAEKLSNHLNKHAVELPEEGHFYSGVKFDVDKIHKNGGVFHTPAFTSTSTTINIAKTFGDHPPKVDEYSEDGFSRKSKRIADNHIIHFKLPKGYKKGMPTKAVSEYGHENEYLLDKGQTWKITGHKRVNETSIDAAQYSNNNKHSIKSVNRIHIWTVEPHEPEANVKEAIDHNPNYIRNITGGKYRLKTADAIEEHRLSGINDVELHHKKLSEHQYGDKDVAFSYHDKVEHHKPFFNYTTTSRELNQHLINKSQHVYGNKYHYNSENRQAEHALDARSEDLSQHIAKHGKPLEEESHMYSGVSYDMKKIHENGGVFHTPAFTSSSLSLKRAVGFSLEQNTKPDGHNNTSDRHIIHFKLPKGYKQGAYIAPVSDFEKEREYLLDKGQTWKITGHKRVNDVTLSRTWDNQPTRRIIRQHIWTVEPHDVKQVTEAKYHEPRLLKGFHKTEYDYADYDFSSPKTKSFFNKLKGDERTEYEDHIIKQHNELHNQQFDKSVTQKSRGLDHQSLYDYTRGSYDLNNYLAKRSPYATKRTDGGQVKIYNNHGLHKRAAELTGVIQKHAKPLKEDTHVYSGTRMDLSDIHKKGGVFHTPAFTSTSLHPVTAKGFGSGEYTHDGNDNYTSTISKTDFHIIHFHLPKGYRKGIYLGGISQHQGENEYLLDKSQRWKIINHQKINAGSRENVKYPDGTRKKLHKEKVHIWTVVPHNIENIKEEFTPTTDSKILHDIKNSTPARTKLQPEHIEEHRHLTDLHGETSEKHNHAVRMFTNLSHELNTSLLNDEPIHPIWKNVHEKLQTMFTETKPLTKEHHVYTGLGDFDPTAHFKHADGVFKIKSYMSTSISPKTAVAHTNLKSFDTKDEHLIHFHLPAGYTGGQYVANHSRFPGEHEMILNFGQKFKLKEHKVHNLPTGNKRHIWSVVPHE